ncbi:hypothetical protein NKR19_g8341 [Coniochaeta hoffmannii]|uniref:Secreted protein n=1 Tax=Coniochaeta hoffmannii TaxID=91930 RepID=A0AA38RN00_9PEZI|nr:hypothetical protein NKR19_g8341 [Coniochaeta hoffmannii]
MLVNVILATVAVLLRTTNAAPLAQSGLVAPNEASPPFKSLAKRSESKSINDCDPSTFEGTTDSGSPFSSDCLQIATNIAGGGS